MVDHSYRRDYDPRFQGLKRCQWGKERKEENVPREKNRRGDGETVTVMTQGQDLSTWSEVCSCVNDRTEKDTYYARDEEGAWLRKTQRNKIMNDIATNILKWPCVRHYYTISRTSQYFWCFFCSSNVHVVENVSHSSCTCRRHGGDFFAVCTTFLSKSLNKCDSTYLFIGYCKWLGDLKIRAYMDGARSRYVMSSTATWMTVAETDTKWPVKWSKVLTAGRRR